jgi:hypothetical protein
MKTLNVTVYAENDSLLTVEGRPDELPIQCNTARFFMMKYPEVQVMLWVLDEVSPRDAYSALQDILVNIRGVPAS